jgi:hypothetical protein
MTDLEEAILISISSSPSLSTVLYHLTTLALAWDLWIVFEQTGSMTDLEEAILISVKSLSY